MQHGRSWRRRGGRARSPSRFTPPPPTSQAGPTISCSKMLDESGYRIKTLNRKEDIKSDVNTNRYVNRSKHRQIINSVSTSCKVLVSLVLLLLCSGNFILHVRAEDLIHHHGAHQRVCSHQHPKVHEVGNHLHSLLLH